MCVCVCVCVYWRQWKVAQSGHKLEDTPPLTKGNSTEIHVYAMFPRAISHLHDLERLELKQKPQTYCFEQSEDMTGAARVANN